MASNFQVWIDSATDDNTLSAADLSSDSQRTNGFAPSQPASSKRVNSMLRQSSLVSAALMDIVDPTGTTTLRSAKSDVITLMTDYFGSISRNVVTVTFTDSQGGTRSLSADKLFGEVVNDYNAGKTIIAKYGIYENFVLAGIQKVAGQIGKLYFAYIDDTFIKIIDFDSYGGEIYTRNIQSLFNFASTGIRAYSSTVYVENNAISFRLPDGNGTYKLIDVTLGDTYISYSPIKFVCTNNSSTMVQFGTTATATIVVASDGTVTVTLPSAVGSLLDELICYYTVLYTFS